MDEFTDGEFKKFCMAACERLGVFPQYRFIPAVAKGEYCKWVYQKSDGDPQKVQRLIDEVTRQYDKLPTIRELGNIWFRLFPAVHERPAVICDMCDGTGYQVIDTEMGSGARRCPQGCFVPDGSYQSVPASTRRHSSDETSTLFERQPRSTPRPPASTHG